MRNVKPRLMLAVLPACVLASLCPAACNSDYRVWVLWQSSEAVEVTVATRNIDDVVDATLGDVSMSSWAMAPDGAHIPVLGRSRQEEAKARLFLVDTSKVQEFVEVEIEGMQPSGAHISIGGLEQVVAASNAAAAVIVGNELVRFGWDGKRLGSALLGQEGGHSLHGWFSDSWVLSVEEEGGGGRLLRFVNDDGQLTGETRLGDSSILAAVVTQRAVAVLQREGTGATVQWFDADGPSSDPASIAGIPWEAIEARPSLDRSAVLVYDGGLVPPNSDSRLWRLVPGEAPEDLAPRPCYTSSTSSSLGARCDVRVVGFPMDSQIFMITQDLSAGGMNHLHYWDTPTTSIGSAGIAVAGLNAVFELEP